MDGIAYRVPQIICPGKVFERRFNAESAARAGARIVLEHNDFNEVHLREALDMVNKEGTSMREASDELCREMALLGGANGVLDVIERSLVPAICASSASR